MSEIRDRAQPAPVKSRKFRDNGLPVSGFFRGLKNRTFVIQKFEQDTFDIWSEFTFCSIASSHEDHRNRMSMMRFSHAVVDFACYLDYKPRTWH